MKDNAMKKNHRALLLAFTALIPLIIYSPIAKAQEATSTALDLADDSVDMGDIVAGDYAADPTIDIDDASDLVVNADLINPNANIDLIYISDGTSSLTVATGVTIGAEGSGDVVNSADVNVNVIINGRVVHSDGAFEDALNFGALNALQTATITVNGGAGDDGTVVGWITGGDDDDMLALNTTGGDILLNGEHINLGAGDDTLRFTGDNSAVIQGTTLSADTIEVSGTGTLDIQSTTTNGDIDFTQDGTIRLGNGQTLNGDIDNSVGGSLGTIVVTGGDVDIDGRFGATNRIKMLELNGTGTTTFLTATPGALVDHEIDTIHFADDANLYMGVNDSSIDSRITVAQDGFGSFTMLQNSSISRNIGAENLRLGLIEVSSNNALALRNGIQEVWVKDVELSSGIAVISFEEAGMDVNIDRILNTTGVNHSGRVRTRQGATLNIGQMGTDTDRLEELFLINDGGAINGQTVTLNTDAGFFEAMRIDQDSTRVNLGKAITVMTFTDEIILDGTNPILGITVDGTNASKIVIDGAGNAVDLGDFELALSGNSGGTSYIPDGTKIVIAQGQAAPTLPGSVSGLGFGTDYDFTLEADGNNIVLSTERLKTFDGEATGTNNKNVAQALEEIGADGNEGISELQNNLQANIGTQAFDEILDTLVPTVDGSIAYTTINTSNQSLGTVDTRLEALRSGNAMTTGIASGNGPANKHIWGQAFGRLAEQGDRKGIAGYDADTYGAAFGIDKNIDNERTLIGAAFSYAQTDVNSSMLYRSDIESYQVTMYSEHALDEAGTFLQGMAAYTFNDNETTRYDVGQGGGDARSDYNSAQYTLQAKLGHTLSAPEAKMTFTPHIRAHYMHFNPENYTEEQAGGLGLEVDPDSINMLELGIGAVANWDFKAHTGASIQPSISADYRYDVIGDQTVAGARFIGAPGPSFDIQGMKPARHTFNFGTGIDYHSNDGWTLRAAYDFEYKADFTAHSGQIKVGYRF